MSDLKAMRIVATSLDDGAMVHISPERYRALIACAEACEKIMHARGDPTSPVTNMGRAMMREIAGEAFDQVRRAP